MYITTLLAISIHLSREIYLGLLFANKALTKVLTKFSKYADIFSLNLAIGLLKHIGMNNHPIELQNNKQLPYSLIYTLGQVELKTLKTYIETHLKPEFI